MLLNGDIQGEKGGVYLVFVNWVSEGGTPHFNSLKYQILFLIIGGKQDFKLIGDVLVVSEMMGE